MALVSTSKLFHLTIVRVHNKGSVILTLLIWTGSGHPTPISLSVDMFLRHMRPYRKPTASLCLVYAFNLNNSLCIII
jgi:hypothetical protein